MEAPTFEEEEKETAVKEQGDTDGKTPSAENGEKKKKKKEKRESSSEMEKEEQGTNKLIKNWENGGQSGSSPQRQVKFIGSCCQPIGSWYKQENSFPTFPPPLFFEHDNIYFQEKNQ